MGETPYFLSLFVLNSAGYQSCSFFHFTTLSSSGLGHSPFTGVTRVRIPLGSPTLLAIAVGEFESVGFEPRPWERPSQIPRMRDPQGEVSGKSCRQSR